MCGIAGVVSRRGAALNFDVEAVAGRLSDALRHRGPDDRGHWLSPDRSTLLAHTRLSILDLSANGHQPMHSPRGHVITYNGEIYNFRELASQFDPGSFRSNSDTEILLRCYEKDGEGCLEYLNGMFAFALYDSDRQDLILARDRAGIKPLYYTVSGGYFAFASEIRALLTLPWIKSEVDEEALSDFLTFNHVPSLNTMFRGIKKLEPGFMLRVKGGEIQTCKPYWTPRWNKEQSGSLDELAAQLRRELQESVTRQLVADVPVGVFLSGGVDSSGVVALASQTRDRIRTYSIGFEGAQNYDETEFAARIAGKFNTEHIQRVVRKDEVSQFLPTLVELYDEPLADATSIPVHFISQLARQSGSTVVLTGDGADELFCGYRRWTTYARTLPWYRMYLQTPSVLRRAVRAVYGTVGAGSPRYELLYQAASGHEVYWGAGGIKTSARPSFLSAAYLERLNGKQPYDRIQEARERYRDVFPKERRNDINWLCFNGFTDAVPNFYCHRADRVGMGESLELRVPYLDNRIIDFAFTLGAEMKIHQGEPKAILKKAFEPILPKEILYRRKMGFCVPVREWCPDVIVPYIEANLKTFCSDTGILNEQGVRSHLSASKQGDTDHAFALWNLYFLMAWMNRWMLGRPSA